jgi:prolyl 4-hydroxylase
MFHKTIALPICEQQQPIGLSLSSKPRIVIFPGFLSHQECDELVLMATNRTTRSLTYQGVPLHQISSGPRNIKVEEEAIVDRNTNPRTSTTFVLSPNFRKLRKHFQPLEDRISRTLGLPKSHAESLQVQHYAVGASYTLHLDEDGIQREEAADGYREATFLIYLNNVSEGGETIFPYSTTKSLELDTKFEFDEQWNTQQRLLYQACHSHAGLKVGPRKGAALLFFPSHHSKVDISSLHGSCPSATEKWVAQQWFHSESLCGS